MTSADSHLLYRISLNAARDLTFSPNTADMEKLQCVLLLFQMSVFLDSNYNNEEAYYDIQVIISKQYTEWVKNILCYISGEQKKITLSVIHSCVDRTFSILYSGVNLAFALYCNIKSATETKS